MKEQWRGAACSVTPELLFWGISLALGWGEAVPWSPWAVEWGRAAAGGLVDPRALFVPGMGLAGLCLHGELAGCSVCQSRLRAARFWAPAMLGSLIHPHRSPQLSAPFPLLWTRLLSYLHTLFLCFLIPATERKKETTGWG